MAVKKNTYIDVELDWAEQQLSSWKEYVDANPLHQLQYRIIYNEDISKNKKHYIYCHFTLKDSLPFYVGIGTHSNKNRNFNRAKSSHGRNIFWKEKAKNKYLIVICNESDDYDQIKNLEKEFIKLYGIENLTNLTEGGEGCKGYKHTHDHILKLKQNYKNGKSPLKNRIVTQQERELKKVIFSGEGNPNYNKKGFLSKNGKVVEKISLDGDVVNTYGSLRDAARNEKTTHTTLGTVIKNNKMFNNFKWRFKYDK